MSLTQTELETDKLLRASWNEWATVVNRFACHAVQKSEYSQERYRALYSSLQTHIERSLEEMTIEAHVLNGMKELSAPWLSVDALASADKKLLKDLTDRCTAIQKTWATAPESPRRWPKTAVLVLLFLAMFAVVLAPEINRGIIERLPADSGYSLAGWLRTFSRNRPALQQGILIFSVASAVMMTTWLVFRPPGRY
ncbi:MAG: hypothetical protein WCK86_02170 [Planctomycetia bacterium]